MSLAMTYSVMGAFVAACDASPQNKKLFLQQMAETLRTGTIPEPVQETPVHHEVVADCPDCDNYSI